MTNPKTILFKYASRSRPKRFVEGLKSIIENLAEPEYAMILVSIDEDDPHHDEYQEAIKPYYEHVFIKVVSGKSANKIHAINRDIQTFKGKWDYLVCMSDDMRFTVKGFDNIIRNDFASINREDGICLHYRDPYQPDNFMTMSIMDKAYYDLFGFIYHPSYSSLYADVEAQESAKLIGKYYYMGDNKFIFVHLHPSLGLSDWDEQYKESESNAVREADRINFNNRKAHGFYLVAVNN